MSDTITICIEELLDGPEYYAAGGESGKAVPFEYIRNLTDSVIALMRRNYTGYRWEIKGGNKWGTYVVGTPMNALDQDEVYAVIRSVLFGGRYRSISLGTAREWPQQVFPRST